ncbi:MAG: hypothetical protein AB1593_03970 [Pseudomonadota bacterium]
MFWIFLIAVVAAFLLIKLGALSVWVGVLSFTLKAVLIAAVVAALLIGVAFTWKRHKADR